jgi:hypothetical protein
MSNVKHTHMSKTDVAYLFIPTQVDCFVVVMDWEMYTHSSLDAPSVCKQFVIPYFLYLSSETVLVALREASWNHHHHSVKCHCRARTWFQPLAVYTMHRVEHCRRCALQCFVRGREMSFCDFIHYAVRDLGVFGAVSPRWDARQKDVQMMLFHSSRIELENRTGLEVFLDHLFSAAVTRCSRSNF